MFSFVTQIIWVFIQTRRQDFAAATKNHKGGNIFKIQYWMYAATEGPNVTWGHMFLNGGRALLAAAGDDPVFIVRIRVYFGVQSEFI